MAEIRLQANVDESQQSQHLVDGGVADRVSETSGKEEVLDELQELHGEAVDTEERGAT